MNKREELKTIIEKSLVYPVFQPIVSLRTGEIHGYEALSRMSFPRKIKDTEELFSMARVCGKTWNLEKVCRKKILQAYSLFPEGQQKGKLFINVNPRVMMDETFRANFTRKQLEKYNICPEKVVIEVTERSSVENMEEFVRVIRHYKEEGYQIAIDDLGACYSGLNIICNTHPHYLKIDMPLIHDIDQDGMKQALVKGLVEIAKNASIDLLAEGIETEAELKMLMELGVDYGQGYFIGMPEKELKQVSEKAYQMLCFSSEFRKYILKEWQRGKYKIARFFIADYKAYEEYAQKYGDEKSDALLNLLYHDVRMILTSFETVHMIDESSCIAVIEKERYQSVCENIKEAFQTDVAGCYDEEDREKGYIERITKKGKRKQFPFVSINVEEIL